MYLVSVTGYPGPDFGSLNQCDHSGWTELVCVVAFCQENLVDFPLKLKRLYFRCYHQIAPILKVNLIE